MIITTIIEDNTIDLLIAFNWCANNNNEHTHTHTHIHTKETPRHIAYDHHMVISPKVKVSTWRRRRKKRFLRAQIETSSVLLVWLIFLVGQLLLSACWLLICTWNNVEILATSNAANYLQLFKWHEHHQWILIIYSHQDILRSPIIECNDNKTHHH